MAKGPTTKVKARALARRQTALQLLAEGKPLSVISEKLCVTQRQIRTYVSDALQSESIFPNSLSQERVSELRTIEGEKLQLAWRRVAEAFGVAEPKNGMMIARLAEATAKLNERQSKLWGLDQPTRIVEDRLSLQVTKSEQKITISWDQNLLAAPAEPVPGLFIGGRTHREALPPVNEPNGNESLDTAAA